MKFPFIEPSLVVRVLAKSCYFLRDEIDTSFGICDAAAKTFIILTPV